MVWLVFLAASAAVKAELATEQEMANVSANFVTETVARTGKWAGQSAPSLGAMHELRYQGILVARYYDVLPQGYVLVPILKQTTPIKAYSDESNLGADQESGFTAMVAEVLYQQMQSYEEVYGSLTVAPTVGGPQLFDPSHRASWDRLAVSSREFRASAAMGVASQGGPLLTSSWHQSAPYNNDCPMGDGGRCVVGCVATASAQILNFWQWPASGVGWHQYTWGGDHSCDASTPSQSLYAVYSDPYDWANIPDDCNGGCSPAQQTALAELNYEVGVALNMDYGACGSGAMTASAAVVFPEHFKYKPTTHVENRTEYSQRGWFDLIKSEIDVGRPMQYRINSHSIVCDGYRDDFGQLEFHMNYGWNEGHTTWYVLDNLYCYWISGNVCPYQEEFLIAGIEPQHDPVLSLKASMNDDALGDGDGLVEPGETIRLNSVIVNGGNDATSTTGTLTTTDPYITISHGSAAFDPIIVWGSESAVQTPFEYTIAAGCPNPHYVSFNLSLSADGGYTTSSAFTVLVSNVPGLEDNFELGQGYWSSRAGSAGSANEWHLETYRSHSSTTSWKMGGIGSAAYSNGADGALISPPLLLPADAKLTFWHLIDAEDDANFMAWDGGIVMVRESGGEWSQVAPEGGYPYTVIAGSSGPFAVGTGLYSGTYDWSQAVFDLSAYSGVVEVMFRFGSDGAATQEGWYVDDVWVGNTLTGTNVQLTPYLGVDVTFEQVTVRGITSITVSPTGQEPPAGYGAVPASPRKYYGVSTTAAYTGSANVCLAYLHGDVLQDESNLKLMALQGTVWSDVSGVLDTASNRICGTVAPPATLLIVEKTGCCAGRVGDVNGDGADEPTIGDVSALIDAKLVSGTCDGIITCLQEADVNRSGRPEPVCDDITIGDISILIDYLFITGPEMGLPACP